MNKWKPVNLGSILGDKGYIRGPFGSALKRTEMLTEGIPVYEQQHAIYNSRDFRYYVNKSKFDELKRFQVQTGDLIISCSGTIGKISVIKPEDPKGIISQALLILRPQPEIILPEFLYYFLTTSQGQSAIASASHGSVQTNIAKREVVEKIQVPVPTLTEQHRIVHILGALDDKIEATRQQNITLEEIARAIFKSWFVDFDPVHAKSRGDMPYGMDAKTADLFPDSFEESEMGLIPRGWRVGSIKDCCVKIENGGTPKRDELKYWQPPSIAWLTSGEIRQRIIVSTDNFISDVGLKNSSAKVWDTGTIVVALYGATAGQVSLLAIPCSTNQACCGLVPLQDMNFYLYLHLSRSTMALETQARGSAQQNLSQSLIANFPVIIPNSEVLEVYQYLVKPIFEKWINNLVEIKVLAEVRDSLLPKLISGEINVGK